MPVRALNNAQSPDHVMLVRELADEWNHPDPAKSEPIILEERDRAKRLVHVYVIWDKWTHVDRVERSEIIMDAAERRLPVDELLNITIAMGLTADEARQMGIG